MEKQKLPPAYTISRALELMDGKNQWYTPVDQAFAEEMVDFMSGRISNPSPVRVLKSVAQNLDTGLGVLLNLSANNHHITHQVSDRMYRKILRQAVMSKQERYRIYEEEVRQSKIISEEIKGMKIAEYEKKVGDLEQFVGFLFEQSTPTAPDISRR